MFLNEMSHSKSNCLVSLYACILTTNSEIMKFVDNITKTFPCNIDNFLGAKNENFIRKKIDICNIFAQNIDCGCKLEPPQRGGSNEYQQSIGTCIPLQTPVFLYKSRVQVGIHFTDMFS